MALTTRKLSADAEITRPWNGGESFPALQTNAAVLGNRRATLQDIHTLQVSGFSDLPTPTSNLTGAMRTITELGWAVYCDGTSWIPFGLPVYDFGLWFPGNPDASTVLQKVGIVRDITIPADMTGAIGEVGSNPAAFYAMSIRDDGVEIGTVTVATNGTFTFATSSGLAQDIVAGSFLTIHSPAAAEASIEDISFTVPATLRIGV